MECGGGLRKERFTFCCSLPCLAISTACTRLLPAIPTLNLFE